jgi:hypothetical protein
LRTWEFSREIEYDFSFQLKITNVRNKLSKIKKKLSKRREKYYSDNERLIGTWHFKMLGK